MQSVEEGTAVLFENHELLDWILENRTKISPGYREKHNHAALHNAATGVGAISIECVCEGCRQICSVRQSQAPCGACRAKELSFGKSSCK